MFSVGSALDRYLHEREQESLAATVAGHSAMLSCDSAGRRMGDEDPVVEEGPPRSPDEMVAEFLGSNPDDAAQVDDEQRARMQRLVQHFGQPALPGGE